MTPIVLATTREELATALVSVRAHQRIALVPTMGALHAGHRSLVARAGAAGDAVVVSIFVNPLQFGSSDDLNRYPRSLEADVAACAAEGAAVVFAPSVDVMYPDGPPSVTIAAGPLGDLLEGAIRPGHFDGVLTVVAKLFGLIRPDRAVFGDKDAQQVALVRRMVHDLDLLVRVDAAPTVRTVEGLAMSSRNAYLNDTETRHALALSRALRAAAEVQAGHDHDAIIAVARAVLDPEPDLTIDYCTLVDATTFAVLDGRSRFATHGQARLLVAGRVGGTRLIDNALVSFAPNSSVQGDRP